jgi:hypothetical protein
VFKQRLVEKCSITGGGTGIKTSGWEVLEKSLKVVHVE